MRFGFSLPSSTDGNALCKFAQAADSLGVESVWTGDHIVLPTGGTDQYPYTPDGSFPVPADAPVMETMTVLSYVAACTRHVKVGSTVVILPYRNPSSRRRCSPPWMSSPKGGRSAVSASAG